MMESGTILVLLASVALSYADFPCTEGDCNEANFEQLFDLSKLLPEEVFEEISSNSDKVENMTMNLEGKRFDDAIDPRTGESKDEPPQEGLLIFHIKQFILMPKENAEENPADTMLPGFQIFDEVNKMFEEIGILDLSGKNFTGDELAQILSQHPVPVTSLVLSNSRIQDLSPDSFASVQDTLQMLKMDNCSVSLQALSQLHNLRFLNLSHNELSTFEWFPQLTDSLEVLDLSHNHFKEIRPELSVFNNLKELYLSHNRISTVTKNPLAMLPALEVLSLTMNSIRDANLVDLSNLQQVDLDWNYLRLFGDNLILPAHRLSVRLASNPWRCDCGILEARDSYDVLDLDLLQCKDNLVYTVCNDCNRYFLPMEDGLLVSNLTVDSIEHLGCTGLMDQFYLIRKDLVILRDREPEKLVRLGLLIVTVALLLVAAVMMCRQACARKQFDSQSWLKNQQIPYLKISKLGKPQDVPYVKMNANDVKI